VWTLVACGGTLDAGSDRASDDDQKWGDGFPIDATTPVVLTNDGPIDNWQGEYAVLLAATGLDLRGVVVNDSGVWPDLAYNLEGWQSLWDAASASGVQGLPELTSSTGPPLVEPASGQVDDTAPNYSQGAALIVREAMRRDPADRPLAIVTGGRLTDVADAYLIEPEIAERIVVVAALGDQQGEEVVMGRPNGEFDAWANVVVVERLHLALVTARYDQRGSVTSDRLGELPENPMGAWISDKHSQIWEAVAADQVSLLTGALPNFARQIDPAGTSGTITMDFGETPALAIDQDSRGWVVTAIDGDLATRTFWKLLDRVF
jgi:hypothetical protein